MVEVIYCAQVCIGFCAHEFYYHILSLFLVAVNSSLDPRIVVVRSIFIPLFEARGNVLMLA
jgi:hypothetical protein